MSTEGFPRLLAEARQVSVWECSTRIPPFGIHVDGYRIYPLSVLYLLYKLSVLAEACQVDERAETRVCHQESR